MLKIGVLVSGGGTNLQAILDAQISGDLRSGRVACVISNRSDAYALKRAEKNSVPAFFLSKKQLGDGFEDEILKIFAEHGVDVVVLAGFMCILGKKLIRAYPNKIINIHPALIPSFCGDGFYGLHVHERALEYGVKVTGATVHFVDEVTDGGAIIMQLPVKVEDWDTPETLQKRVMVEAEQTLLPKALELLCAGRLVTEGRRVTIKAADEVK